MDDAKLWLETAYEDLNAAEIMLNNQKYSHACFLSQQSTEKSIKALHIHLNGDPWGHSILKLLSELKQLDLEDSARILDRYYIPTIYPDSLPDITPSKAFGKNDGQTAFEIASIFIDKIKEIVDD